MQMPPPRRGPLSSGVRLVTARRPILRRPRFMLARILTSEMSTGDQTPCGRSGLGARWERPSCKVERAKQELAYIDRSRCSAYLVAPDDSGVECGGGTP